MQEQQELSVDEKQKILDEANKPEPVPPGTVVTEVTSIKKEELKSGIKMEAPTAEKLVAMASASLIKRKKDAQILMTRMSKKQIMRSVLAFLDLPTDGVPVYLKEQTEKLLFATGQRAIQDRFIIIQHHINQEISKQRLAAKQQTEAKANGEEPKQ